MAPARPPPSASWRASCTAEGRQRHARGGRYVPGRRDRAARRLGAALRSRVRRAAGRRRPGSGRSSTHCSRPDRGRYGVLLADTAGRLHSQSHLMEELKKVKRVDAARGSDAPHEVLLVLDANQGQNALSQAIQFHEAVGVTGPRADEARWHGEGRHRGRASRAGSACRSASSASASSRKTSASSMRRHLPQRWSKARSHDRVRSRQQALSERARGARRASAFRSTRARWSS